MIIHRLTTFLLRFALFSIGIVACQHVNGQLTKPHVYVDNDGIMRWGADESEVQGFGVNYTVPFAHAYRSAKKLGVDPLEAIDADVYHFARLGFDLYRVHVWDCEISDTLGNLLYNEHLHTFDYLLYKLAERDINYVLTPIAFWGNGWPEPDEETPGFSAKYGKDNCLTNPEAIKAQANYLEQFMDHVNPYTGVAYRNDPHLIAMEISNEPHHRGTPEEVTAYISKMVKAVQKTGYNRPIFYNASHAVHLMEDYFKAGIDGGTFQWYPTGLGYQQPLPGNFLPNVDRYVMPFDSTYKQNSGAKLVYEFDAADVNQSYIYPAMARSFRTAGIQVATHFSYDPTYLARFNTEYNTHHMNLAYTPDKALALKICSEIFHEIPMGSDFGKYPDNTSFNGFTVDYYNNLASYLNEHKFFHTNSTDLAISNPSALNEIAGRGNSSIVAYNGNGAYFLDQVQPGIWRLEVMPDVVIFDNAYGRNSLDKVVASIQWTENQMILDLPDLGNNFSIKGINKGNKTTSIANHGTFTITPGTYLLSSDGQFHGLNGETKWKNIRLGEFEAPGYNNDFMRFVHQTPEVVAEGSSLHLDFQIMPPIGTEISNVQLIIAGAGPWTTIDLLKNHSLTYSAEIPSKLVNHGILSYYVLVHTSNGHTFTYPAGSEGKPWDWDFHQRETFQVPVVENSAAISLFDASTDASGLTRSWWSPKSRLLPINPPSKASLHVEVESLVRMDPENLKGKKPADYSIQHFVNKRVEHIRPLLKSKETLVLTAGTKGEYETIQVALIDSEGNAIGATVQLKNGIENHRIPLSNFKNVSYVTMPRPYPTFLPYHFIPSDSPKFDILRLERIQISIGPEIPKSEWEKSHEFELVELFLE